MKIIEVDEYGEHKRLDKFLIDYLSLSRTKIQKAINNKDIKVNDKEVKNSYLLKIDDIIA